MPKPRKPQVRANVRPLDYLSRESNYVRQNGTVDRLTPRQYRRLAHKDHKAMAVRRRAVGAALGVNS